jgi:hypothetical protein
LRRRQNHARKPMIARPTIGPTTAPAIQALLEDFDSSGGWVKSVGVAEMTLLVPSAVVITWVDRGMGAVSGQQSVVIDRSYYSLDDVFAASGWTR